MISLPVAKPIPTCRICGHQHSDLRLYRCGQCGFSACGSLTLLGDAERPLVHRADPDVPVIEYKSGGFANACGPMACIGLLLPEGAA